MFRDQIDGKRTDDSRIIIALEPFLLYTITLLLLYVLQFGALRTKNIVSFSETVLTAIMKSAAKILPCLIAILAPTIVSSGKYLIIFHVISKKWEFHIKFFYLDEKCKVIH